MKLVLAEKPSIAQSIAKVLGENKREDGFLIGNGYIVSWWNWHSRNATMNDIPNGSVQICLFFLLTGSMRDLPVRKSSSVF